MQFSTVLATFFSVAMAAPLNETHVWYISDLTIKHQTGLPSLVAFDLTDGFAGTADPISCQASSSDNINTTIIADVSQASCGDDTWQFDYTSLENEVPNEIPLGGHLVIRQTISSQNITPKLDLFGVGQESKTFEAVVDFHQDDFKRTVRTKHWSALTRYTGPKEFTVTAEKAT
ncbi:hypothetical protein SLS62_000424 [Diatrype stigma]|uniref:AA1-like domain-containing protein n=1 Tax=Diatrype stigma TaxID=117547 RepID=A0AAN9YWP4_9PEZI